MEAQPIFPPGKGGSLGASPSRLQPLGLAASTGKTRVPLVPAADSPGQVSACIRGRTHTSVLISLTLVNSCMLVLSVG
jgi:hypothetical protein